MALSTYEAGEPEPEDGWLISDWNLEFSPTEWQADNVFEEGAVTVLQLDPDGSQDPFAGAEVQQTSVNEQTGTWVWDAKAPEMVPGTVFGLFLFQSNPQDPRIEFDFEIVGDDPTMIELVTHMAMADGHIRTAYRKVKLGFDPAADFNRYEVSLAGGSATFKINGSVVATFDKEDFNGYWRTGEVRSYVNLWATDAIGWAGEIDPETLPIRAEIRSAGWNSEYVQREVWFGGSAADNHRGTALADILDGQGGTDQLFGESGNDKLYGEAGSDKLYGWTGTDRLYGGGSGDSLYGQAGNDFLYGGDSRDTLDGGTGTDRLEGGLGDDTFVLASSGDTVVEAVDGGTDTVRAAYSYTLGANVENLVLTGTAVLTGTGNDLANLIVSNSAANTLVGLAGNDTLQGNGGADRLQGSSGHDRLEGGTGQDALSGGAGNDIFVFASRAELGDIITDFGDSLGNNDRFFISAAALGGGLEAGKALPSFKFQVADDNILKGPAEADIRFIFEADATRLWFDSNGSGAGGLVLVADLQAGTHMTAADIWLT